LDPSRNFFSVTALCTTTRGPNSDDRVSDDLLMGTDGTGWVVWNKNVSSVDSAVVSGYGAADAGARNRRRQDSITDRTVVNTVPAQDLHCGILAVRRPTVCTSFTSSNADGRVMSTVIHSFTHAFAVVANYTRTSVCRTGTLRSKREYDYY